jgi:hypothetical protein
VENGLEQKGTAAPNPNHRGVDGGVGLERPGGQCRGAKQKESAIYTHDLLLEHSTSLPNSPA